MALSMWPSAFAGNGSIHAVIVRGDAARRRKRVLAPGPEAQALALGARYRDGGRASFLQHSLHFSHFLAHLFRSAVGFRQQNRRGREVVAGLDEGLDGACGFAIHHLQPGRDDSGGDDGSHGFARLPNIVVGGHHHACELRSGNELQQHFRHDEQQAFGADGDGEQIEAGTIGRAAPELYLLSINGVAPDAEHVVDREAILEAVNASRILRDVATNRAGKL